MSDTRKSVTVGHASFWFIDETGRNRVALRGDVAEVTDDDFERGQKHGAFLTDAAPAVEVEDDVEPKPEPAAKTTKSAAKAN